MDVFVMRAIRGVTVSTLVIMGVSLTPATSSAQENAQALRQEMDQLRRDFEALRAQYDERLTGLEQRLATLEGAPPPKTPEAAAAQPTVQVPPGAAGAGGPAGALPVYGAGIAGSKIFNPDIAVIGDFLGAAGTNTVAPPPAFEMHESEASFQAVVDPYARADFFISFGESGVNLEEGYMTFTSLLGGLLTRVGKMRAAFGKVNTLHNHVLPWTDRPLVTQDLVGGEDGINDAGLSLSRLIPAPKGIFLEGIAQLYRGDSDDVFQSRKRSDVSTVEHLHAYRDLSESTNIDIGGSFARGKSPFADGWNQLYGIDAMLRWKP